MRTHIIHTNAHNAYYTQVEFRFRADASHATRHAPIESLNKRLVVRCEGPFGLLRGGFDALLIGSCFAAVTVRCGSEDLEQFEALYGHRKRYENMPLGELLEKAFAYRELVSTCQLVTRERGGVQFKV
jgi:hypothetical protein